MNDKQLDYLERRLVQIEDKVEKNTVVVSNLLLEMRYIKEHQSNNPKDKWEGMGKALGGALTGAGTTLAATAYVVWKIIEHYGNTP